jgi:hypothetical protein
LDISPITRGKRGLSSRQDDPRIVMISPWR